MIDREDRMKHRIAHTFINANKSYFTYKGRTLIRETTYRSLNSYYYYTFGEDYYDSHPSYGLQVEGKKVMHCTINGEIFTNLSLKEWTERVGFIDDDYEE
jgi:hypothetical protein